MLSISEQFFRVSGELFTAQTGVLSNYLHTVIDTGVDALEQNVEMFRTQLASTTVATRLWLCAGAADGWPTPAPRFGKQQQLALVARTRGAQDADARTAHATPSS